MSHTHPISQPPEPLTSTSSRPPSAAARASIDDAARRLRAELAGSASPERRSRLLVEIAEVEERGGDEPAAARDYMAAYNADGGSREPLEALVRLLEKRRSLRHLGKIFDALLRAAVTPDERVRALLMRAGYEADVSGDLSAAKSSTREATLVEAAPNAEKASAWLAFEVLAGRTGDTSAREAALAERARFASSPEWRALLSIDRARLAADGGNVEGALTFLDEARSLESPATWSATKLIERLTDDHPGISGTEEARARGSARADAIEAAADHVRQALIDAGRGDALGVPSFARDSAVLIDLWLRAAEAQRATGQVDRAAVTLDGAISFASQLATDEGRLAAAVVTNARRRMAELTGDTAFAARLAERRLESEQDDGVASALAMTVAEHCAAKGDREGAFDSLSRALRHDPACLPARALQLDMLADGGAPAAFAATLQTFAEHLSTDEARSRTFLLASYVWAVEAKNVNAAKTALGHAAIYGVGPSAVATTASIARLARVLASVAGDAGWYEEASELLLQACRDDREKVSLSIELMRSRNARGDRAGEARARRTMAATHQGAWLGHSLEAFVAPFASPGPAESEPSPADAQRSLEHLVTLESDRGMARGLSFVAALRDLDRGDVGSARAKLRTLLEEDASDALVATVLSDLDRSADDLRAAAGTCRRAAAATRDGELSAALRMEAGFDLWRVGERQAALDELEASVAGAPEAARAILGWAAWGVGTDSMEGRRKALRHSSDRPSHGDDSDAQALRLERFATEMSGGDAGEAATALAELERGPDDEFCTAGAIGRLVWSAGALDARACHDAVERLASRGPLALVLAAAEQTRMAREAGHPEDLALAAARWFAAGGGLPSALEWLAAATALDQPREQQRAWLAVADALSGEARESVLVAAALLELRTAPGVPAPLARGSSTAVRLANLEFGPPGCDPRRRSTVLSDVAGALGRDAGTEAKALAGWSFLAAGDLPGALALFESTTLVRPDDVAAWEGLRTCAEMAGDHELRGRAAAELGARCHDAARGAAFWEEAALAWLAQASSNDPTGETSDPRDTNIDRALEASFARDPKRSVAFDKLFRRVRARKENDQLLELVTRRLSATDEPQEIQKLFWEQARVLREKGDHEGALKSLEHVMLLEPDHVGALALLGEINIRRGKFEEAAASLARLATLEKAPAKSRVTAGVAAVDLYENKLDRHDRALEVLLALHAAKLSTLPVRERLARTASRTGAWESATATLEELMHERPEASGRVEAARLAMAIHRDRLGNRQAATAAVVTLLGEVPADGEALEMLLQTEQPAELRERLLRQARESLFALLRNQPTETTAIRRLAKVARALGDHPLERSAVSALNLLGAVDGEREPALGRITGQERRVPQIEMSAAVMRAMAAPGDDGPLADLFVVLGPTLTQALGPTLQSCGVGKRDRVDPRSGLALRNEIAAWAGAFQLHDFDVYVGGNDALGAQGIPGDPPALVVGARTNAPLGTLARARVAREVFAIAHGTAIVRSRDEVTIAAIVAAACKLAGAPFTHPSYAVLPEVERLIAKAISRKTRKLLPPICHAIVASRAEARAWSRRALASHDRVALLASGDATTAFGEMLDLPPERLGDAVRGNERAEELLRFMLSPGYLSLRRSLGLEEEGAS